MLNVSEGFKYACINGAVKNNLDIRVFGYTADGGDTHIRNDKIVFESMAVEQSICDESDLRFGGAVAGSFEIEVVGVPDLTGKYITVWLTQNASMVTYPGSRTYPGGNSAPTYPGAYTHPDDETCPKRTVKYSGSEYYLYPGYYDYEEIIPIFSGEVYSCELSKNHLTRKLIAYDRMYWRGNINCTEWYQSLYNGRSTLTIYELRKAICRKYGIVEEYPNDELPGDNIEIEMTEEKVTVAELLRYLCELNGVFCMFNGLGNLEYHTLSNDSSITESIRMPGVEKYDFDYKNLDYKEFARYFTGLACRYPNGFVAWFGEVHAQNLYYILNDNELANAYKSTTWMNATFIGMRRENDNYYLLRYFKIASYVPINLTTRCRLWVQPGDKIEVKTHTYVLNDDGSISRSADKTITSYVLSRKIKGMQAMMDDITADGEDMRYNESSIF